MLLGDCAFLCRKCVKSYPSSLEQSLMPQTKDARRAIKRAEKLFNKVRTASDIVGQETKYRILVWGPAVSPQPTGLQRKRLDIKSSLISLGHEAMFSEDLEFFFAAPGKTMDHNELDQVTNWANFVVVLLGKDAYGATAEVHDHSIALKEKALIWLPHGAAGSYSASGTLRDMDLSGAKIEFYNEDEIELCVLKTGTLEWIQRWVQKQNVALKRIALLQRDLII